MTSRVYKYPLSGTGELNLPTGAEVLHVDAQGSAIFVWVLVDVDAALDVNRKVIMVGTGHDVPPGEFRHINTFLVDGGQFVFHAFEVA